MPASVAVYTIANKKRSRKIAAALAAGARKVGYSVHEGADVDYKTPDYDVAAFYGYEGAAPKIMQGHIAAGKPCVFLDLGYWGRHEGGRFTGYHKVAVNARHPVGYFQRREHSDNRLARFGVGAQPYRAPGGYVLLAGMSGRAAKSIGFDPGQWERWAVSEIRKHTDRPIVYRPKPSCKDATPMPGTKHSGREQTLAEALSGAHVVVTHHSNVAVDGLAMGVPAFAWDGVAKPMALQDLARIEDPYRPEGREQWLADIAWCQWSVPEIAAGHMWRHLKDEGLIP